MNRDPRWKNDAFSFFAVEFAILDVINSAIPNVVVNVPTANVPFVPSQGGAFAFASAQGPVSQVFTVIRDDDDDDDKRK